MISNPIGGSTEEPGLRAGGCSIVVSDETSELPVINIVGEIDLSSAPGAYSVMWRISGNGKRSLIINLEELDFMDSSGLQALLRLREKLRVRRRRVLLVGAKPPIKKLFRLTGFDQLFQLFPDAEEARKDIHPTQ